MTDTADHVKELSQATPPSPGDPAPSPSRAPARPLPLVEEITGAAAPVKLRAWDGSTTGTPAAPTRVLRSRHGLRRLLWQPDELGLAQAYVSADLDVEKTVAFERGRTGMGQVLAQRRSEPAAGPARPQPRAAR